MEISAVGKNCIEAKTNKIFLLLGGNKLNYGIVQKFHRLGYLVYVVDWNEQPQITGDKHYKIDIKDSEKIIYELKRDNAWKKVLFAYSSIDLAVPSVAKINRELGLQTISDEGIKCCLSKSAMTQCWEKEGLLNRFSIGFSQYSNEVENLGRQNNLIIKPDNSASSRGITVIPKGSAEEMIKSAFRKAQEEASNHKVVVEEFVEGTEFTVEMLGDSYGNVCVYGISQKTHTDNTENNKIAVKLHYNSTPDELQKKIANVGIRCYKTLGITASLGHLEVLLKEDGTISPVEIGARSSGFIASDLVDIVSGANYLGDLIDVLNGAGVVNGLHHQEEKSSIYFFYDFPEGSIVKNKCNILDFCDDSIISRYHDRSNIAVGMTFHKIDNDNARWGYEILEGSKNVLTQQYIENAEQKMLAYMLVREGE